MIDMNTLNNELNLYLRVLHFYRKNSTFVVLSPPPALYYDNFYYDLWDLIAIHDFLQHTLDFTRFFRIYTRYNNFLYIMYKFNITTQGYSNKSRHIFIKY